MSNILIVPLQVRHDDVDDGAEVHKMSVPPHKVETKVAKDVDPGRRKVEKRVQKVVKSLDADGVETLEVVDTTEEVFRQGSKDLVFDKNGKPTGKVMASGPSKVYFYKEGRLGVARDVKTSTIEAANTNNAFNSDGIMVVTESVLAEMQKKKK